MRVAYDRRGYLSHYEIARDGAGLKCPLLLASKITVTVRDTNLIIGEYTLASIAGAIAEALYHGVPATIATQARAHLDDDLTHVLDSFNATYLQNQN